MTIRPTRRPGYTLVAVLIVIVVLSLAAYRFTDAMTAEYQVAVRSTEVAEARAAAISGVLYTAGALSDPDTLTNTLGGNPYDNPSQFSNVTLSGADRPRGGTRFTLFAVADTGTGTGADRYQIKNGVTDEAAKLNVNALIALDPTGQVLYNALMTLPNMTEDIADAIVDYIDADDNPRTSGAETAYYSGLTPPYQAKNGPLNSLDELLLVRGVTPQLLYGNDRNRNGRLDPGEDDGNDYNRGWSEYLTVYGRELDLDVNGNPRVVINMPSGGDVNALVADLTNALGQEMADYVLYYVLGGQVSSNSGSGGQGGSGQGGQSGQSGQGGAGGQGGGSGQSGTTRTTGTTGGSGGTTNTPQTTTNNTRSTTTQGSGQGGQTSQQSGGTQRTGQTGQQSGGRGNSGGQGGGQTVVGTADQLHAAVQQLLQQGKTPSTKLTSIFALYNTTATLPQPQQQQQQGQNNQQGQQQTPPTIIYPSPMNDPTKLKDLLPKLLDATTPRTGFEIIPRVNVNTAPPEVLMALPGGLTQDQVDAIVAARANLDPADPATATGAWLVTQANISPSTFQQLEQYITGKTMTYRVQSVGYFGNAGPTARVEAVFDTNQGHPRILYFRDLTDLGRGFDLPR